MLLTEQRIFLADHGQIFPGTNGGYQVIYIHCVYVYLPFLPPLIYEHWWEEEDDGENGGDISLNCN